MPFTEKSNENKYLIFTSRDKNKEVSEKCKELWDEIKSQIRTISGGKPIKYGRDFMKIRFESDDNLPLGKISGIPVGSVFKEDNYYHKLIYMNACKNL